MKKRIVLGACFLALLAFLSHENRVQAAIAPGDLVIREFRLKGPSSALDEYIVIHNRTSADITVASFDASAGFSVASSDGNVIFTIPEGTVIKAHGHFLAVNTTGFTLGVPYDASWTTNVGDGLGLALFDSSNPSTFGSTATKIDAVGIGSSTAPYLEGTALPPVTASGEYAWVRKAPAGVVQDTNDSATDFVLVATDGGTYSSVQSILGPPTPANSANQDVSAGLAIGLIEPSVAVDASPNRETFSSPDTLELRRRITNNTGASIPALRLRVVEVSTLQSPGYSNSAQADLRPMTSGTASVTTTSIGVTWVVGLSLLTPPTQSSGGGWNSILAIPGGALADGASVDVNVALSVARAGTETFFVTVETAGTLPVGAPTMTPAAGTYAASQSVSLSSSTVGAAIYYTTDGSTPTTASTLYTGTPIAVAQTKTIKALGVLANWADSPVSSAAYTLAAGAPMITPNGSTFAGTQSVTLSSDTESPAEIWYTLDGSIPTASAPSILYSGPLNVSTPTTVKAATFKTGWTSSSVSSASFTPIVATPVFSPGPGTYTSSQAVTITSSPGAAIYYTTDGSTPTPSSNPYSGPVNLTQTTTLKAAAFLTGWANSAVTTGAYTIKVADPVLSPAGGRWRTKQNISVTTATSGATLRYTTDGTEPTSFSTAVSSGVVVVDKPTFLRVRAFKSGATDSQSTRGTYNITGQIAVGDIHTIALKADGSVWAWGRDDYGMLGNGAAITAEQDSPIQVMDGASPLTGVTQIAVAQYTSYALKADGTILAWGYNANGQIGDGGATNQPSPVFVRAVGGGAGSQLTGVVAIAAGGAHALAVLSDGTVKAWGLGTTGELGQGSNSNSSTPVAVSSLTSVKDVAAGGTHSLALKTDGTVASWGWGFYGQLGNGGSSNRNTPGALSSSSISGIVALSTRGNASFAVKADGTLYAFGDNTSGLLGDGTTTNRLVPVVVRTGVRELAAGNITFAFTSWDGRWWANGYGGSYQLGDGMATTRYLPIRSGVSTPVVTLATGNAQTLAVASTGAVWGAGINSYGQLGLGNHNAITIPAAVPSFSMFTGTGLDADLDGDGLTLFQEIMAGTDPNLVDSNGNGISDKDELMMGYDPSDLDSDHDGLTNAVESIAGTDPFKADTDGDGVQDGVDAFPLDATKTTLTSTPGDSTPPVITLARPISATPIP